MPFEHGSARRGKTSELVALVKVTPLTFTTGWCKATFNAGCVGSEIHTWKVGRPPLTVLTPSTCSVGQTVKMPGCQPVWSGFDSRTERFLEQEGGDSEW